MASAASTAEAKAAAEATNCGNHAFAFPAVTQSPATQAAFSFAGFSPSSHVSSRLVTCKKGHACVPFTYQKHHNCDLRSDPKFSPACLKMFSVGDDGFRCSDCDYDVCLACYGASVGSASAAFGASAGGGAAVHSPMPTLACNRSNLDAKIAEIQEAAACIDTTIGTLLVRARCMLLCT